MARLLSGNVGLPRDIEWKGRTVHTGIWKAPVAGRCRVGRFNLDGDGQGDRAGHGGEQRAVFVYQIEAGRSYVCYSKPGPRDTKGEDFDVAGHVSRSAFDDGAVPRDADAYLCGPVPFMDAMKEALAGFGVAPERIHAELFNGGESMTPGIVRRAPRAPHPPNDDVAGPLVSFARSGISAHWKPSGYQSLLEPAEACDVPVRWSCRTGVCHSCESGLVSGTVACGPEPLDAPADGNVLVCCARPTGDVVVDL